MAYKTVCLFMLTILISTSAYKSYENYKVYKVVPNTEVQVQILTDLSKDKYEFWNDDDFNIGDDVRILVPPQKDLDFVEYIKTAGLHSEVIIQNVQELINNQMRPSTTRSERLGSFSWDVYHTLSTINTWMAELVDMYPTLVRTVVIGQTAEGRDITGIIIDLKPGERTEKPLTGIIEGGIHSREWISPATVTWIAKEFLTSTDPGVQVMAEAFVWHIFPVMNPDGYEYTFSSNRMWRKNRNPSNHVFCGNDDDIGNGVDLNRNFNFRWMSVGASVVPCSNTYAGPSPSSEQETQAISNYVNSLNETATVLYYLAFHSYGQMILVPFSHTTGFAVLEAENYGDLYEIAIRGADKLESVHGTPYNVGTSAEILYAVSGSSFDWVKGVQRIPIVYLFELRDTLQYGFLLPPEEIVPNNEEIMACLVEMDRNTRLLGYYSYSNARTLTSSLLILLPSLYLI